MRYKLIGFVLSGFLITKTNGFSQQEYYPFETSHFHFIDYSKNRFTLFDDSSSFAGFFQRFGSLLQYGTGQLKIVHIGGSHSF